MGILENRNGDLHLSPTNWATKLGIISSSVTIVISVPHGKTHNMHKLVLCTYEILRDPISKPCFCGDVRNRQHFETNDCYLWPLDSVYVCIFKSLPATLASKYIQVISIWESKGGQNQNFDKLLDEFQKEVTPVQEHKRQCRDIISEEYCSKPRTAHSTKSHVLSSLEPQRCSHVQESHKCNLLINNVPVKTCQCTWHYPELQHFFWFYQRMTGTWRHKDPRPNVPPRRQCCAAWLRHSLPYWIDDRLLVWRVADVHLQEQHVVEIHWIWIQIYAAGSITKVY